MCGVAGFYNIPYPYDRYPELISDMLTLMRYRGPDEAGYYYNQNVCIGNVRLAITDQDSGSQPMQDVTQHYWLCFNGEIYNYKTIRSELQSLGYKFLTNSDTEVLLNSWLAWGSNCFKKLNGSFAVVIYDKFENTLILARDRFGKKPLYYIQHTDGLVFSSEMKSFLALDTFNFTFNPESLASIYTLWGTVGDITPFDKIKQIPAGTYAICNGKEINIKKYYEIDFSQTSLIENMPTAAEHIYEALSESVKLRIPENCKFGTFLSGGLDSAIVTKLAADACSASINSFSICFNDNSYDEKIYQEEVANYLHTEHVSVTISNEDIMNYLPISLWHAEAPQFRTALVPMYLLAREASKKNIKVVLTGEGADEIFLGYDIFKESLMRYLWKTDLDKESISNIIGNLYPYLDFYKNDNYDRIFSVYSKHLDSREGDLFSHAMRFSNAKFFNRFLNVETDTTLKLKELINTIGSQFKKYSILQKSQWIEFNTFLTGNLLSSQGDRMVMANGIENRCPFLDHNVFDISKKLPDSFKLRNFTDEKYILKRSFEKKLPEFLLNRKKFPYRSPGAKIFLDSRHSEYLDCILSEGEMKKIGILNMPLYNAFIKNIASANKISPRDDQIFIFLLSISILHNFFVLKKIPLSKTSIRFDKIINDCIS